MSSPDPFLSSDNTVIDGEKQLPASLPKDNFTNGSQKSISHKNLNEMLRLPKRENFGMSGGLQWWGWLLIVIVVVIILVVLYFAYNLFIGGRMKLALGAASVVGNLLKSKNSSTTSFGRFKY